LTEITQKAFSEANYPFITRAQIFNRAVDDGTLPNPRGKVLVVDVSDDRSAMVINYRSVPGGD
jgi:hypothetical protein